MAAMLQSAVVLTATFGRSVLSLLDAFIMPVLIEKHA